MQFLTSFGRAPLAIAIVALIAGMLAVITRPSRHAGPPPDLTLAVNSREHLAAYKPLVAAFAAEHGKRIQIYLVENRALQSRLQAALQSGAAVPDLVELVEPSIGYFTRGPLAEVGLVDLTQRIDAAGLRERMVASRFALWSSRERIFALPHDVHPVALAYRADLCAEAGIDPETLTTWDAFLAAGRKICVDRDGDGNPDRYMIDLPMDVNFGLQTLLRQRGGSMWDAYGNPAFDNQIAIDTVCWYVRATRGPGRIACEAGSGQTLAKAMLDGLALFYLTPDWRSKAFESDVPQLAGKLRLMPMPAWKPGGRRTSTLGGTGIAITRACRDPDLAWQLAQYLYLDLTTVGERFAASNIIPSDKRAWADPALDVTSPFWGIALGKFYHQLAPDVPAVSISAWEELARTKLNEALLAAATEYERDPASLPIVAETELKRCADYVRSKMSHSQLMTAESR